MDKLKLLLEQHRRWLTRGRQIAARELEYLEEDMAERSLTSFGSLSDSLGILATFHGVQGEIDVLCNDDTGCMGISRSIMYRYWALMLKARMVLGSSFLDGIRRPSSLNNQVSNAGCLLASFLAGDRPELARSVADVLELMVGSKRCVDSSSSGERPFELFMLWLHRINLGGLVNETDSAGLGVYGKVVEGWLDEHALYEAIKVICDYHLDNVMDEGADRDPEFKNAPFDLLPWEVMAIIRVRQRLMLNTPSVSHPLLAARSSMLGKLHFKADDIIVGIEDIYSEFSSRS